MKKTSAASKNKKGFSLIELAIVLVIFGIMLYGAVSVYAVSAAKAKIDNTNTKLDAIEAALRLYYQTNGDLPCPADGSLALSNSNFGKEVCGTSDYFSLAAAAGGVVPTRTLNLPDNYMMDAWNNRITYIVSDICDDGTIPWTTAVTGCIAVSNLVVNDNNSPANQRTAKAAYVVISHGKNGIGAWRRNGSTRIPRTASTTAQEKENAQVSTGGAIETANLTYGDGFIKDWSTAETETVYFDDLVRWKLPAQISYVP